MTNYFFNYSCPITITITITENSVMITANYNYKLPLPQHCNQLPITFIVDTGAAVTLLSRGLWDKMNEAGAELTPWQGNLFVGVDGTPPQIHGASLLKVWLGKNEFEIHC